MLLTIEDYYKLVGNAQSVADLLSMPGMASDETEIEFNPIRAAQVDPRAVDLS